MPEEVKLYESPALRTVTGPTIRPGGLALTERALAYCTLPTEAAVLDVGCGNGATVAHLRRKHGLKAFGLDASGRLLGTGRNATDGLPLIRGRAEALPFADSCLAAIFCECVLSLLSAPQVALGEWHRVLAPRGYLVVSDLYARNGEREERPASGALMSCLAGVTGCRTLHELMRTANFEVLLFEDHTPLLKRLAAQLVWAYGSMAAFWKAAGGGCGDGFQGPIGRSGYYLMVARRGAEEHG